VWNDDGDSSMLRMYTKSFLDSLTDSTKVVSRIKFEDVKQ